MLSEMQKEKKMFNTEYINIFLYDLGAHEY